MFRLIIVETACNIWIKLNRYSGLILGSFYLQVPVSALASQLRSSAA